MLNLDNQERAFIYQWMGSLLSKELNFLIIKTGISTAYLSF